MMIIIIYDFQVVDGHKITVNDTIYENEKNGAVYRFQVVEILPADSQETGEKGSDDEKPDKSSSSSSEEKDVQTVTKSTEDLDVKINTTEEGEEGVVKPDQNSHDNEIRREEVSSPENRDVLLA